MHENLFLFSLCYLTLYLCDFFPLQSWLKWLTPPWQNSLSYLCTHSLHMESHVRVLYRHPRPTYTQNHIQVLYIKSGVLLFSSSWSLVPVRGLWYCCLMRRGSPYSGLVGFCCCASAVAALTRGDMSVWVPGLIAATGPIVFLCSTLIDSPRSRGIPTGTQRQTNLGGQSITDARVTAQRSGWLRISGNVGVCERLKVSRLFSQSLYTCLFLYSFLISKKVKSNSHNYSTLKLTGNYHVI